MPQSAQPQVCLRHSANLLLGTPCLSVWDTLGHLPLHLLAFPRPGALFAVQLWAVFRPNPKFILYFVTTLPLLQCLLG